MKEPVDRLRGLVEHVELSRTGLKKGRFHAVGI